MHFRRIQRGLSQAELAQLAGVSRTTIQKIESGQEIRPGTVRKLAECLRVIEWDLLAPEGEWSRPYRTYTNIEPQWLVTFNRAGSSCLYPDGTPIPEVGEKERMGRLGFVSAFMNRFSCDLPTGRLHAALAEVYGKDEKGPYRHPEEEFVYVLRGQIRVRVGQEYINLSEGQAMTFWSTELHSYGLPRPLKKDQAPPLILMVWMAAAKPDPSTPSGKRRRKSRSTAGKV